MNWIIFWIESWVKQYWIEYWMNHLLAKFKHWIESQIGYRPPLPPFHPVIPLLHPYTPVPAWYKPITPYCITVTPSYTPVAWSTNCLDLSIVSKFNLADPSRTICSCCHFFFTVTFTSQGAHCSITYQAGWSSLPWPCYWKVLKLGEFGGGKVLPENLAV